MIPSTVLLTMASSDESTIACKSAVMPWIPAIVGPFFSDGPSCMGLPLCANVGTRRRFKAGGERRLLESAVSAHISRQPRKLFNHRPVPTQDSRDIALSGDGISH